MRMYCTACGGTGYEPEPLPVPRDTLSCPKVRRIVGEVEREYGTELTALASPLRRKDRVTVRDVLIERLDRETDLTLKAIGILLGRNHSTIWHSLHKHEAKEMQRTNGVAA
jgi:chromosomal replication initiation ATPase DnaA